MGHELVIGGFATSWRLVIGRNIARQKAAKRKEARQTFHYQVCKMGQYHHPWDTEDDRALCRAVIFFAAKHKKSTAWGESFWIRVTECFEFNHRTMNRRDQPETTPTMIKDRWSNLVKHLASQGDKIEGDSCSISENLLSFTDSAHLHTSNQHMVALAERYLKRTKRTSTLLDETDIGIKSSIKMPKSSCTSEDTRSNEDKSVVMPPVPKKRTGYLSWDDYFMSVAFLSAMRSKGKGILLKHYSSPFITSDTRPVDSSWSLV
jgi:hypothetical protein